MTKLALGALSGWHSYSPESATEAVCNISETVVTSDLSTMIETPVRGPLIVSLVWYQVTVVGEERVEDITQVRFTMLEVSRYSSGPPRNFVLGSKIFKIISLLLCLTIKS